MNVNRRWWGTSMLGFRILAAGMVLLGAGCALLGWGARRGKSVRDSIDAAPAVVGFDATRELQAHAQSILAGLPLVFEPNRGQANLDPSDPRVQFVTHGSRYGMVLGTEGAILNLISGGRSTGTSHSQALQMKLAGANATASLSGVEPLPGKSNYFIGSDPAKWRTGIPQFARVHYENVYPGIDLVFYGKQGHLEYDFQVAAGSDPSQAELEFIGAKELELKNGSLVIAVENGSVQFDAPKLYQEIDGRKQSVEGAFVLRAKNRVGFSVGAYDHSRELVIDPILNFSTYFGGSGNEHNTSVAVDGSLNIYLAGSTTSTDLPVPTGAFQGTLGGTQNVYLAKIQPPLGSVPARIMDVTYLGGSGSDYPVGIAVDGAGDPYVAGTTSSGNFPTVKTSAYQPSPASAGTHVFVTRLKSDFTLLYSSYLSGNGTDIASGMTIDPAGDIYVTGTTTSVESSSSDQFPATNLPMTLPYQSTSRATAGTPQFFVTKINTTASLIASIPYSTYFGGGTFSGTAVATGGGIAVDTNLNIYFTGTTNFAYSGCSGCSVTDFPILNAYQPCLNVSPSTTILPPQTCGSSSSSASDAFVAKLNPNAIGQGQQLVWSTYVGGGGNDSGVGIALDSGAASVYIIGTTNSTDFVAAGLVKSFAPYQACLNNVTLTPPTGTVTCAAQTGSPVPNDAFVARLSNPTATSGTTPTVGSLNYFSYLGGSNNEAGNAITVDSNSGAVITGWTQSPYVLPVTTPGNFPLNPYPSSIQSTLNGPQDAFIARLNTGATVGQTTTASWASYFGGTGTDAGTGIALDVNQNSYLAGETDSTDLQIVKAEQTCLDVPISPAGTTCPTLSNPAPTDSFVTQFGTAVSLSIQGVLSLGTGQQYISAGNPAQFTYTVTNNGPDLASNIVILADLSPQATGIPLSSVSANISTGTCGAGGSLSASISCGPVSLQSGATVTVNVTATPTPNSSGASPLSFNGGTVQAVAPGNIVLAQTSVPAQMTDFSMSVSPSNQVIAQAGDTATYTVQLTPHPLYTSSITVSCSGLPAASSCPSKSVSLSNTSGASVALSVTTTPRPVTTPAANLFTRHFYAFWFVIPGLVLVGAGGNRRRRRIVGMLALCMLSALILLIPACSSSRTTTPPAGTQAGSYTITITSTAGSDAKSQTVGLTVP